MNKALYFIAGVALGVGGTWYFFKTKYEKLVQEDIESVKEQFSNRKKSPEGKIAEPIKETYPNPRKADPYEKPSIMEYAAKLAEERYTKFDVGMPVKAKASSYDIYAIPPEEFGEMEDYDTISLTYYADDILADDMDELVDGVGDAVGEDFAEHFGEYEDDSVFIRNDIRKVDYEILRSELTYEEVLKNKPGRVEVR